MTVFREESGAVGLSGRDLPAAEALAGHASVLARAREYQASGAFGGRSAGSLEALAYLHLLNGVSAREAITFASSAGPDDGCGSCPGPPGGPGQDDEHGDDDGDGPGDGEGGPEPPDEGEGGGHRQHPGSDGDGTGPGDGPPRPDEPGDDDGPDDPGGPEDPQAPSSALAEVTIPLATLQARAERAGDSRLLGPLDPALARDLAAAAARSPASRWEIIVGRRARLRHRPRHRPARTRQQAPAAAAAATSRRRRQRTARPGQHHRHRDLPAPTGSQGRPAPLRSTAAGRLAAHPEVKPGTWTLTLPGGQQLTVRFYVVPTHACDHRYQVTSYLPGDRLRRLVQVRDDTCTWPPCSRPARESDFEHAIPYYKGGKTDACNAGARSRRCHQVKQLPGWTLTQPRPGWHVWTTPTGRSYVQEPWRYTA